MILKLDAFKLDAPKGMDPKRDHVHYPQHMATGGLTYLDIKMANC